MLVLGHPVMIRFPGGHQRFVDEAIERWHQVFGGELHDRLAAGLLVAGQQEAVQGQRVHIGSSCLLLDQATEDTRFDGGQGQVQSTLRTVLRR